MFQEVNSMKRTLAILLSLIMVAALCTAFVANADDSTVDLIPAAGSEWSKVDHGENTITVVDLADRSER